jgi:AcrR family transcriptional regulator
MAQKTKRDWLVEGLRVLGELGATALTIDALTGRLGVTKGSFYHHFQHYHNYKEQLLTFFEEVTLHIIAQTEQEPTSTRKIARLLELATREVPTVEVAVRAWALQDEQVRRYQERIDQRRMDYLTALFAPITGDKARARFLAHLYYALYIGSQHLLPPIQQEAVRQFYRELLPLLQPVEEKSETKEERDSHATS